MSQKDDNSNKPQNLFPRESRQNTEKSDISQFARGAAGTDAQSASGKGVENAAENGALPVCTLSEDEIRDKLTDKQYYILREKGTEQAFTSAYYDFHEQGIYACPVCGQELFSSETKYDSGSGWPSFWEPITPDSVKHIRDTSYGMTRVEVVCSNCGSHLGHVFDDGPQPTGKRFCINSVSLDFQPVVPEK